jgi:hypothetical protein
MVPSQDRGAARGHGVLPACADVHCDCGGRIQPAGDVPGDIADDGLGMCMVGSEVTDGQKSVDADAWFLLERYGDANLAERVKSTA